MPCKEQLRARWNRLSLCRPCTASFELDGARLLKLPLDRVKVALRQPVIDSKGVNNRRNRQNRKTRRNFLPNCYQKHAGGFGAESWGIGPFAVTFLSHFCTLSWSRIIVGDE